MHLKRLLFPAVSLVGFASVVGAEPAAEYAAVRDPLLSVPSLASNLYRSPSTITTLPWAPTRTDTM